MTNKVKEITISAVIPTSSFANITPSITVSVDGDINEAKETALEYIVGISKAYSEDGKELEEKSVLPVDLQKVESTMTGGVAYLDAQHHFWTAKGDRYLSASRFASKYVKPFPKEFILPKMVGAYGGTIEEHEAIWNLKAETSTEFGKAIHSALEVYGRHHEMGAKTGVKDGVNKALTDNVIIQPIVQAFFTQSDTPQQTRLEENALYEVQIIDEDRKMIAEVDRIKIVDEVKKIIRIQDYKTNFDVNAKEEMLAPFNTMPKVTLSKYWLQLSFEADILTKAGWKVEGLDIFHLTTNGWKTYSSDVIDLSGVL